MNTPNPLIPQGSLEAHQYKKRSTTKIFVSAVLAIHGVVLGGLLFLGCEKEPPSQEAGKLPATNQFSEIDHTPVTPANPFGDLPVVTNGVEIPHITPPTNNNPFGTDMAGRDSGLTSGGGDGTFPPNPGFATSNRSSAFPPLPGTNNAETSKPLIADTTSGGSPKTYTVLPNDTFTSIASHHNVSVKAIVAANPNVDPRRLRPGQELNLPANVKPVLPDVPEVGAAAAAANETIYSVKSGDTLYDIGKHYGVTVKELQRANGIVGSTIHVGQKLIIPTSKKSGTK